MPWDQALDVILRGNGLDYSVDGTIVRISKIKTLEDENKARQSAAQAAAERQAQAGGLAFETFPLSYAKAAEIAPLLKGSLRLSKYGQVQVDVRTNTLIIADLPEQFGPIRQLLATLDRAEPQVEVEARIVQTTRDFAKAIGVQWGLNGRVMPDIGNTTSLVFPNQGTSAAASAGRRERLTPAPASSSRRAAASAWACPMRPRRSAWRSARSTAPSTSTWRCRRSSAPARAACSRRRGYDAEQHRSRDHARYPDPDSGRRQRDGHRHLQGRRAHPQGHAADYRGQHGDHENHGRERAPRISAAGQRHSAGEHAARPHARPGRRRCDDGHRRHLRGTRDIGARQDAGCSIAFRSSAGCSSASASKTRAGNC